MKKCKALTALLLALLLVLGLAPAVSAENEPDDSVMKLALGDSGYTVTVPAGYYETPLSEEDRADDMVASYSNDTFELFIDLYEVASTEELPTLEAYMQSDCTEYNGTDFNAEAVCNGTPCISYRADTEFEGVKSYNVTYAFASGDKFVQLDFSWADEKLNDQPAAIMETLLAVGTRQISLGKSGYGLTVSSDMQDSDIASEEAALGLCAAYFSPLSGLAVDVFEFENTDGVALEDAAKAQAAAYGAITELNAAEINGVPAVSFVASSVYRGTAYNNLVLIVDNNNGGFTDVVFYLTSYSNYLQATRVIRTLSTYKEEETVSLEPMIMRLGGSLYTITLPNGFTKAPLSAEDIEDDQLASFIGPYACFDFDLYDFPKDEEFPTIADFTEKDAADYNGTDIDLEASFNGVPGTYYRSYEDWDDISYICDNYTLEDDDEYIQLCFYYTVDNYCEEDVRAVMETLTTLQTAEIAAGDCKLTVPADYAAENILDAEGVQIGTRYVSPTSEASFGVYSVKNEAGLTLADFTAEQCAIYEGSPIDRGEINGVPVTGYAFSTDDSSEALDVIFENADGSFTELFFLCSSEVAYRQCISLLDTLMK